MKQFCFRLISSKVFFFIITTVFILSLNLTPLISFIRHAPPGRTFALVHNNTQDYFFYLSLMNEGKSGQSLTTDPYTSEPHRPSIIFSYFLWFGKLGSVLGLSNGVMYHIIRIVASILFLSFIFYLISFIDIPHPRLCFFFFLFASPLLHQINDGGKLVTVPFMNWWTGMDAIRRIAYLPHHMIGGTLLVVSIILIIKLIESSDRNTNTSISNSKFKYSCEAGSRSARQNSPPKADQPLVEKQYLKSKKLIILLIFIAALLAYIHTPSLFIILLVLPSSVILYFIFNIAFADFRKFFLTNNESAETASPYAEGPPDRLSLEKQENLHWPAFLSNHFFGRAKKWVIYLLGYWVIGLLFLLFMVSQTKTGFPWSQYIDWEKRLQFPLSSEIIGALGILFPLSLIGAAKALYSKRFDYILIACWLFVPLAIIPFAPKLNLSNVRLIQGVPYLPLAILAVLGIDLIINTLNKTIIKITKSKILNPKQITNHKSQIFKQFRILNLTNWNLFRFSNLEFRFSKIIGLLVYWLIILLFVIFTYPTLAWSLKDQIREYTPIFGNVYFDNRLFNAFSFINNNFPPKIITLSTFYTGNYLPSFTHTTSFLGHFGYTYKVSEKDASVRKFFENKMTDKEAKDLILNNKITLVVQGPEEKPLYPKYLYPNLLKTVYDKDEMTIYMLK